MKTLTLEDMTREELLEIIRQSPCQPSSALLKETRLKRLMEAAHGRAVSAKADMDATIGKDHVGFKNALKRATKAQNEWMRLTELRYPNDNTT